MQSEKMEREEEAANKRQKQESERSSESEGGESCTTAAPHASAPDAVRFFVLAALLATLLRRGLRLRVAWGAVCKRVGAVGRPGAGMDMPADQGHQATVEHEP